ALEVLRSDALRVAVAGQAEHDTEGGRVEVVGPPVVLRAAPSGADGHHLESHEPPLLEVESSEAQEPRLQAAPLGAGTPHVAVAPDRPTPLVLGPSLALQAE